MAQSTTIGNLMVKWRGSVGTTNLEHNEQNILLVLHDVRPPVGDDLKGLPYVDIFAIDEIPDENTKDAIFALFDMFKPTKFSQITVGGSLANENVDFFKEMEFESFPLPGAPSNMMFMLSGAP